MTEHPRLDIAARKYIGVPFRHQGRNPDIGIDCVGLLVLAARDCGLHELAGHDFTSYAKNPAKGELERRLREALGPPVSSCPRPGDVVSMEFTGMKRKVTRHVGLIGEHNGRLLLIHTYRAPKKVIDQGLDERWLRRITGIYRLEAV